MKSMKSLFLLSTLALSVHSANGYDVVSRYKIIDDKLKTEQMLRPYGHDFFIDLGGALDPDIMNVMKDVKDATTFSGTNLQKLNNASTVLTKYDKTEQTVKVNLAVGIPIFSFSAWDVKVQPNVRAFLDFGINLGIRTDVLTIADLLKQFPVAVPADLSTAINTLAPATDVVTWCIDPANSMSVSTKTFCSKLPTGTYLIPSGVVPNMALFAKMDGKVGLFNDYTYGEHFFGNLNLYGLVRSDIEQIMTKNMIANGAKVEMPKKLNTEGTMQMDYRLGYQNSNYTTFLSVEELKLSRIKERDLASRAQVYGYDPLLRLHADATYKYSAFSLQPFMGVHKRNGYTLSDGVYGGASVGAHVWGERIGVQLRGMLDKQYITITPRFKLWLMQLEYSLKSPVKSTDGDVKLSAIHSVDFRLFF
jgi:hypothetical protein